MINGHSILLSALAVALALPWITGPVDAAPAPISATVIPNTRHIDWRYTAGHAAIASAHHSPIVAYDLPTVPAPRAAQAKRAPAPRPLLDLEDAVSKAMEEVAVSRALEESGRDLAEAKAFPRPKPGPSPLRQAHGPTPEVAGAAKRATAVASAVEKRAPARLASDGSTWYLAEDVVSKAMRDKGLDLGTAKEYPWMRPGPSPLKQAHVPAPARQGAVGWMKQALNL